MALTDVILLKDLSPELTTTLAIVIENHLQVKSKRCFITPINFLKIGWEGPDWLPQFYVSRLQPSIKGLHPFETKGFYIIRY
jgi:hypothetical protein